MRISLIQMNMAPGAPEANYAHAKELIEQASADKPDVIVFPEVWTTGFFPKDGLGQMADDDGERLKKEIGQLARSLNVNIVAGSIVNRHRDKSSEELFNTTYVFDRQGKTAAVYDKTHLFSPMGEGDYFTPGSTLCRFELDGVKCGMIICYDLRFPELIRKMTVEGIDVLFHVAQWPLIRSDHLRTLIRARAIENQMFVASCNSCGILDQTQYGGGSVLVDPWGTVIAEAGQNDSCKDTVAEQIVTGDLDMSVLDGIRSSINVFRDRRPELY